MARPLAYITSVWSEMELEAKEQALKYCRLVYEAGYSPICPKLMHYEFLNDNVPQEHTDRIAMAAELLRRCRIVIVCGAYVDEQVKNDIAMAKRQHIVATTLEGILTVDGKCKKKGA